MGNLELLQLARLCKHNLEQINPQVLQKPRVIQALTHINRIISELEARIKRGN